MLTGGAPPPVRRTAAWTRPGPWLACAVAVAVVALVAVVAVVLRHAGTRTAGAGSGDPAVECVTPTRACPVVRSAAVAVLPSGPVLPPSGPVPPRELRALQMNLCDSGIALDCYTHGGAVTEAAGKIATVAPDIVTLNEVCQRDVLGPLLSAMEAAHPTDPVVAAFEPAWNRSRGQPFRCTDGDSFGDGVVVSVPAGGYRSGVVTGGTYPEAMQDQTDDEERGWVCVYLRGAFYACTSHLVANHPDLAARQCGQLMDSYIPGFVGTHGVAPVVLGADLNLVDTGGKTYDVRFCVPYGYYARNDPGEPTVEPQHFIVSDTLAFRGIADLDMDRTTDHPGLLLTVRAPGSP